MSIQFNLVMLFSGVSRWGKQGSKQVGETSLTKTDLIFWFVAYFYMTHTWFDFCAICKAVKQSNFVGCCSLKQLQFHPTLNINFINFIQPYHMCFQFLCLWLDFIVQFLNLKQQSQLCAWNKNTLKGTQQQSISKFEFNSTTFLVRIGNHHSYSSFTFIIHHSSGHHSSGHHSSKPSFIIQHSLCKRLGVRALDDLQT